MADGGGKIYSTFGYMLKVEPAEFADGGCRLPPQAHFPGAAAKVPQSTLRVLLPSAWL